MKLRIIQILITIALIALDLTAQTVNTTQPQRKIALVIGNGNYQSGSILANPENDAKAMKVALERVGFTVMEYENLSQVQMKKAIDDFGSRLKGNDVGLFFYAGHGIQSKGYNFLIPVDAQLKSEQQVEYDCVQADRVLALMEASGSKVNIIILDACRNNPFERSWTRSTTGSGLAFMNAPRGSLIAYATSPGSTASDGSGNNGLYTSAILESMKIPNITVLEMFQNVRNIVSQKSNNKQTPWESTSLTGNFYINTMGKTVSNNFPVLMDNSDSNMSSYSAKDKYHEDLNREYEWSSNGIKTKVRSCTEIGIAISTPVESIKDFEEKVNSKEIAISDKFPRFSKKVIFDASGLPVKEISFSSNSVDTTVITYLSINNISTKKTKEILIYDPINKTLKEKRTTSISRFDFIDAGSIQSFSLPKNELLSIYSMYDKNIVSSNSSFTKLYIKKEYDTNGYLIREINSQKVQDSSVGNIIDSNSYFEYKYLEFDLNMNWTKRIRFFSYNKNIYFQTRTYEY